MATIKKSCQCRDNIARNHIVVTCRCGTSVVRNLKFLTPFFVFLIRTTIIILSTNRSYVISPCVTNKYFNKLLYIQASNRDKISYLYQAVNNDKNISIYFTVVKALRQINNIVNKDIGLQTDQQFQQFQETGRY